MRGWRAALVGVLLAASVQAAPPAVTSADGRWRIVADGQTLTVFDAAGRPMRSHMAAAADGSGRSAVTALHDAAPRRSFVVIFETLPELWEISYDPDAEPIYQGLVHDYRLREGIAEPGFLNPRRTRLDAPLRDAGFDSSHAFVIARAPDQADGQAVLHPRAAGRAQDASPCSRCAATRTPRPCGACGATGGKSSKCPTARAGRRCGSTRARRACSGPRERWISQFMPIAIECRRVSVG